MEGVIVEKSFKNLHIFRWSKASKLPHDSSHLAPKKARSNDFLLGLQHLGIIPKSTILRSIRHNHR